MDKNSGKILTPLINKALKHNQERTFFWPNQNREWLDFVLSVVEKRKNKPKNIRILIIGGVFYSCYIAAKGYYTTSVEKNPLASISQLYTAWLIASGYSKNQAIARSFLLDLVGERTNPHKRERITIPEKKYLRALNRFKKFLSLRDIETAQEIFNKMLGITKKKDCKSKIYLNLIKKGIGLSGFNNASFRLPNKIITKNIKTYSEKKPEKFDLIISTNVIDFFPTVENFLFTIFPLLEKNGILEITTYNQELSRKIKDIFPELKISKNRKRRIGKARLLKKISANNYLEVEKDLILGRNVFLIRRKEIKEQLIEKIPYWVRELLLKNRFHSSFSLFRDQSWYFSIENGKLTEVKKKK